VGWLQWTAYSKPPTFPFVSKLSHLVTSKRCLRFARCSVQQQSFLVAVNSCLKSTRKSKDELTDLNGKCNNITFSIQISSSLDFLISL